MDASAVDDVLRLMSPVQDPRRHNRLHPLPELIVMAVIAVLCGADSWDDVGDFCIVREQWFGRYLSLPRGIPCHDTFARVFARLEPAQLEEAIGRWMKALGVASGGRLISIDGKKLRGSFEKSWDLSGMAHIVSAFASENKLVLAQLGLGDKDNEITAIGRLLEMVDLKDAAVTIDAIGCQKEFARKIQGKKGHYILNVKENQPTLHAKVKLLLDEAILEKLDGWNGSTHQQTNGGHGRIETRTVWYTTDVQSLGGLLGDWPGLRAVAAVQRRRQVIGQEPSVERHYYILSDDRLNAEQVGSMVRSHWSIENSLHHVLDVSYNEDKSRVRKGYGAENLSRLRRLTANLHRLNPRKRSIKGKRKSCGWSDQILFETLLGGGKLGQSA